MWVGRTGWCGEGTSRSPKQQQAKQTSKEWWSSARRTTSRAQRAPDSGFGAEGVLWQHNTTRRRQAGTEKRTTSCCTRQTPRVDLEGEEEELVCAFWCGGQACDPGPEVRDGPAYRRIVFKLSNPLVLVERSGLGRGVTVSPVIGFKKKVNRHDALWLGQKVRGPRQKERGGNSYTHVLSIESTKQEGGPGGGLKARSQAHGLSRERGGLHTCTRHLWRELLPQPANCKTVAKPPKRAHRPGHNQTARPLYLIFHYTLPSTKVSQLGF